MKSTNLDALNVQASETVATNEQRAPKKRVIQILKRVVAAAALLLITVEFVLTNVPKLSVDVSRSLRPDDPIATAFSVSNDSMLPIYDVTVGCEIARLDIPSPRKTVSKGPTTVYFPESRAEILPPGHKMTVPCGRAVASRLDNEERLEFLTEVFLVVTYRPKWLLWHKSEAFPMKTEKSENGTWVWKSIPR
jgi:hypothetical protein